MEHATLRADSVCPLPLFWPVRGRFYGTRIRCLPTWYVRYALQQPSLPPNYRAALRAAEGFAALACDQQEGRN